MNHSPLGDYLKELRSHTDYEQVDIAVMIGKSRQAITAYETGRIVPPLPVVSKLAKIYNISPESLYKLLPNTEVKTNPLDITVIRKQSDNLIQIELHYPPEQAYLATNIGNLISSFNKLSPEDQLRAMEILNLFFQKNE